MRNSPATGFAASSSERYFKRIEPPKECPTRNTSPFSAASSCEIRSLHAAYSGRSFWHLRTPHVVRGPQRILQGCRQLPVFLVRPLPAAVDEQDALFHSSRCSRLPGSPRDTRRSGTCRVSCDAPGGGSKKTKTTPPGASHLSTMPRARSGSR